MIEEDNIQIFPSQLDSDLVVMIVYPESSKYDEISHQFQKSGHAFILHEAKTIAIDGAVVNESWFTIDHLMVIQAHEVGHYRAGHALLAHDNINIEKEADWIGCQLLSTSNYASAARLHKEEYFERYGTDPELDSIEFKEKLEKFVHLS